MDTYHQVALSTAKQMTTQFSSSFGLASRLFPKDQRQSIYNIYGLVRLADEIVDTYRGADALSLLDQLEQDTYQAITDGYSTNLVVHAFQITAREYEIGKDLVTPFFASMRTDIKPPKAFTKQAYQKYIYGSAEVVGLMCLKVFCQSNDQQYEQLKVGAQALGSAFQKVNFLRDLQADHNELERFYFPGTSYEGLRETDKQAIIEDIHHDFMASRESLNQLPKAARKPVLVAYLCYGKLLDKLAAASVGEIKTRRIRLSGSYKLWVFVKVMVGLHGKA